MLDRSTLNQLLDQAILAPSSHNTQPWIFELDVDRICLHADRTRALPANDPNDRELMISCGCALLNLRAAAAAQGLGTSVTTLPDRQDADLLAAIAFSEETEDALAHLAPFIPLRRTYRKRFSARKLDAEILPDLQAAAEAEGAWLVALESTETRKAAAMLVSEGDRAQWADPRWRSELARWMHPRRKGDGLTLPWIAVPIAKILVRSFDLGRRVGAKDSELAENAPLLAVLGTRGDKTADRLAAGQALERVLLKAARAGFQASYLNQPVQVSHLRPKLADVCKCEGHPQILLRLGYPVDELPAAPRRPVADVVKS